jgi:monoamine oxidase
VKVGLQFKRRFWEEDEAIYGGITLADLPIRQIGYPSTGYHSAKGILLAYPGGTYGYEFAALSPEERARRALCVTARSRRASFESSTANRGGGRNVRFAQEQTFTRGSCERPDVPMRRLSSRLATYEATHSV